MSFRSALIAAITTPSEYKLRLQYLESTGTQYINTGITLTDQHSWELSFAEPLTDPGSAQVGLFGCRETAAYKNASLLFQRGGSQRIRIDHSDISERGGDGTTEFNYNLNVVNVKVDNKKLYINKSTTAAKTFNIDTFTCTKNALLFHTNGQGVAGPGKCKLNYCKIWDENHKMVRYFIPVLDLNSVACMYDQVTGALFYNQGTGVFYHNPVPLHYLESTGTQYIDTGIVANGQTKVETEIFFPHSTTRQTFFGAVNASGHNFALYYSWGTKLYFRYKVDNCELLCSEYEGKYSHIIMDKGDYYIDDVVHYRATEDFATDCNLYVFAKNNNNSVIEKAINAKIKFLKIWSDGTLVRDYIPAFTGVPGMYDRVTGQMFYNAGSGNFVYEF